MLVTFHHSTDKDLTMSAAPIPPGGPLEIVFSFDTTGSMYGYLDQVKGRIQDMIQRLQADIPGIKVAVLAHGDYCDAATYVTKWIDFTNDVTELCDFVNNVGRTGGGDSPECYELAMRKVRTELSWTPGSRRAFILIGDDEPHEPNYYMNSENIDWRAETRDLALMGVTIYAVQCGSRPNATPFYKTISTATSGRHLELNDMGSIFDVLMAVCYRESSDTAMLADYEKEVRDRCGVVGPDVDAIFASLRSDGSDAATKALPIAAPPSVSPVLPPPLLKKASSLTRVAKPKSIIGRKKRAPGKINGRKQGALEKFKLKNLPLLKRENVPDSNFNLRNKAWSTWLSVLKPELSEKDNAIQWTNRAGLGGGYRRKTLPFRQLQTKPWAVLFEVAVQHPKQRRRVVYSCISRRDLSGMHWESRLLRGISRHVGHVLDQGCQLLVRCCTLQQGNDTSVVKKDLRRYDYPWGRSGLGVRVFTNGTVTFTKPSS